MPMFIRQGGWPMLLVLAIGVAMLYPAVRYMLTATAARQLLLERLTKAMRYTVIGGVAANLSATAFNSVDRAGDKPDFHLYLVYGIGESLTVALAGYTILGVVWLMIAVGTRRATQTPVD